MIYWKENSLKNIGDGVIYPNNGDGVIYLLNIDASLKNYIMKIWIVILNLGMSVQKFNLRCN